MTRLRVGTTNPGKLRELAQMLAPLGYTVQGLDDLPDLGIVESGVSFADNACIKVRAVVQATGEPAIADDSGLVADALGGAPGIYSARYAGEEGPGRDAANRHKLLEAMRDVPDAKRTARFVCALAYLEPDGEPRVFFGELEGRIGRVEQGANGFGYDPVFVIAQGEHAGRTAAQLSTAQKNAISHRGRALAKLVAHLRRIGAKAPH